MARISELHYSNAYASSSGVSEFLEVALGPSDDPADFTVTFYQDDGSAGFEITLDNPGVQVTADPDNGEIIYVISADFFDIRLTDPDGGGSNNYEAYALTETGAVPPLVIDFYDIGGGTQNILALDGAAAGATSENLGVLTGPGSTTTTLQFNQPDPDTLTNAAVDPGDTGPPCFTAGTMVDTVQGPRAVETLVPGDLVLTRDHGAQPLRWSGTQCVSGLAAYAPVLVAKGVLGANRDLRVSPQHRLLVRGWRAEMFFGADEILVAAKDMVDHHMIRVQPVEKVIYVHLLFDRHEILTTDGLESESFFPGAEGLNALGATAREILDLFPELKSNPGRYGKTARPVFRGNMTGVLRTA